MSPRFVFFPEEVSGVQIIVQDISGTYLTSEDGLIYTLRSSSPVPPFGWKGVAWNGSVWGRAGNGKFSTSTDGINWTPQLTFPNINVISMAAVNGIFCVYCDSSVTKVSFDNGLTWFTGSAATPQASSGRLASNGSQFQLAGQWVHTGGLNYTAYYQVSNDGLSWVDAGASWIQNPTPIVRGVDSGSFGAIRFSGWGGGFASHAQTKYFWTGSNPPNEVGNVYLINGAAVQTEVAVDGYIGQWNQGVYGAGLFLMGRGTALQAGAGGVLTSVVSAAGGGGRGLGHSSTCGVFIATTNFGLYTKTNPMDGSPWILRTSALADIGHVIATKD